IFTARSRSRSSRATPTSSWGFGAKSKTRGVPQRRTSTLSLSLAPRGTEGWGTLGISRRRARTFSSASFTSPSTSLILSPPPPLGRNRDAAVLLAHLLRASPVRGLQLLALVDQLAPPDVAGYQLAHELCATLLSEGSRDLFGSLPDQPDVEHGVCPLTLR